MKAIYILFSLLILIGCSKPKEEPVLFNKVDVKIDSSELLGESTIIVNGSVILEKDAWAQKVGFCWNISSNPTIENDTVMTNFKHGDFSFEIKGLKPNTKYYLRAYANSGNKVIYSDQIVFTTKLIEIISQTTYRYNSNYNESAYAVTKTSDGGFVVAGMINPYYGLMDLDVVVLKYDQACNLLWSNVIKETSTNEIPVKIITDSDGNIVLLSNLGVYSSLTKINNQGTILWKKTIDGQKNIILKSIIETIDGQYAMVGYRLIYSGSNLSEADGMLVKTNKDGEITLEKNLGNINAQGGSNYLAEDIKGNFLLIGNQGSPVDLAILKTDSQGNTIWTKTIARPHDDVALSVIKTSDGNFAISGVTKSFYTNSIGLPVSSIWLIKLDGDGNIIFEKAIGHESNAIDTNEPAGLIECKNGDFMTANSISGPDLYLGGALDMYVLRTDAKGNLLWDKRFGTSNPSASETAQDLLELNTGEIIVVGKKEEADNVTHFQSRNDLWILKIRGN